MQSVKSLIFGQINQMAAVVQKYICLWIKYDSCWRAKLDIWFPPSNKITFNEINMYLSAADLNKAHSIVTFPYWQWWETSDLSQSASFYSVSSSSPVELIGWTIWRHRQQHRGKGQKRHRVRCACLDIGINASAAPEKPVCTAPSGCKTV